MLSEVVFKVLLFVGIAGGLWLISYILAALVHSAWETWLDYRAKTRKAAAVDPGSISRPRRELCRHDRGYTASYLQDYATREWMAGNRGAE